MSIAVAPPAVMITMIVMQRHIPAFSIGRPVPGPRLRHIGRAATTTSGRAGRHQCGRGNEGGCGQAADHRFGRHGSFPCDPTIVLELPQTDASSCDRQHALDGLPRAAAPTVRRVQGGTGRRRAAANRLGPCPNSAISRRRGPSRKPTPVSSSGEANSQYEFIASPPPPPLLFRSLSLPAPKFARRQRRRGGRW